MVGAMKLSSRRPLAILNIDEDRRQLAELTMTYRVEVQNLVAQAAERVFQLRVRNVIVSTSEGSRRKKAARNKGAKEEDDRNTCVEEQQKDGEQGGPSAPSRQRSLEESQDEASRRAVEGDQQESKKAAVDTKPVRAGHKRGRRVAVSQSKSKRSKVQRTQASPEEPTSAAVASCGGMDQPPLQGGTAEAGAAPGVRADAASGKAPVHSEHAPVTEEAAARPLEDLQEKDYQPLSFRVQSSAMGNPADDSRTQAENRSAPVPVPSPAGSRQTRLRRVQTAVHKQARLPPAAAQRALRKNARQKRDVNEAELTSPGLHPKAKPTRSTVNDADLVALPMYTPARTKPAAVLGKDVETSLVAEAARGCPHNASRAESGPSSASGQAIANGSPRVLPTELPQQQQQFVGVTGKLRGTSPAWKPDKGLRKASEHLGTGLSRRELVQVSELATDVIDRVRPEQSGAGPSAVGEAGGRQQSVLPEPLSNMDPPATVQMDPEQTPAAPSANTMQMPVHSPVTSGKVVVADVRSQKTPLSPRLVNGRARPLAAKAHISLAEVAPLLSIGLFSFGIKPKEHSSPSMPHFGVGTEQPAAEVLTRDAQEETDEARADNATVSVYGAEDPDFNSDSGLPANLDQATGGELLQEDWQANRSEEDDADTLEPRAEAAIHLDARNRSLSLSLAILSPIAMAPGAVAVIQQDASATSEPCVLRPSGPVDDGSVQLQHVEKEVDNGDVAGNGQIDDRQEDEADDGHPCEPGMDFCEASMQGEEAAPKNVAAADMAANLANMAAECGTTAEPDSGNSEDEDREEQDHSNGHGDCARTSINPDASEQATVQLVEAQAGPSGGGGVTSAPAPPNKPKGGNLVSCVRSFLPQRNAPTPPPAAGKKPVKVKALEAALAVKQKEAVRQAERAHARAAVADRRQGQGDAAHPSNANSRPDTAQVPPSVRLTPSKSAARTQGGDAAANCITTAGVGHPAQSGPTSSAAQEKRNDGATGAAAVPIAGSVRAKATFFQEQAKKATVAESGVGRRPAGGAGTGAQSGGFSNKAGPGARVALAIGQNEGALTATFAAAAVAAAAAASAATVVAAGPPASATKSNVAGLASGRAGNPAPVAGPAETIADKQKRVEAKRREDDERRRAELEARTKAKDDKLRGIETAKQQQRMAGGGGAPRPPPPLIPNPLAVQVLAKRLPLTAAGATAGQAGAVQVKPEPENSNKIGPPWLSAAKTPGPKIASAKTPGPKAGPTASNMVSPAVQLQVKLLPAVHAEGPKGAGGAPGLPKSRPGGTIQTKQAQVEAAIEALALSSQAAKEQKTPAVVDLTEEERRNVQAIQTSPYVMQVKPRTPGMLTATKPVFNNYEISPYRSDSDASDDDGVESGRVRKPMPTWAAQDKVLQAVKAQAAINPDTIFGHYPSTIDLVKVFAGMPPASLTVNGGRPRRDYRPRGSSGIWSDDS